jgi:copper resistance protein C
MTMRRTAAFVLAALVCLQAHAHGFLEHAEPRVGARVAVAPAQVVLRFSQAIEPAFSRLRVEDANGQRVDRDDSRVDDAHREVIRVSLPALTPGDYKVVWRAVSVDAHVTTGDYAFHVGR